MNTEALASSDPEIRQSSYPSMLLIGPTGSGKTPFGDLLESSGVCGQRCVHFDFGESLRKIAAGKWRPRFFDESSIQIVKNVLERGELLSDSQFSVASAILSSFADSNVRETGLLVLNGLPRHIGQATALQGLIAMKLVINLVCTPSAVFERIRMNSGGDRRGRSDDAPEHIARRLAIFQERTAPLLEFYRAREITVLDIEVSVTTTPREMLSVLEKHLTKQG